MQEQEWRHQGARLTFRAADRVGWFALNGVLSIGVLNAMRKPAEIAVASAQVGAIVLRLESAVLALSGDDVDAFYGTIRAGRIVGVPGAWVVSPVTVPEARRIAWRIARAGIVRVVFSDFSLAGAWARTKAQRGLVTP